MNEEKIGNIQQEVTETKEEGCSVYTGIVNLINKKVKCK
jgi:hypothetical protein